MRRSTLFDAFSQAAFTQGFTFVALLMRLVMGGIFLGAGVSKLTMEGGWSAAGYLANANGPLSDMFISMAGNAFVEQLNMWGLTLIGVSLLLGLGVRTSSFFAAILMMLYYLSDFAGNTMHGYIDWHIYYVFVFMLFMFGGFGHMWGLDGLIERRLGRRREWIKIFLG
jgi:thiosulfate dehydrogenase [quinone] large subunit